MVNEVCVSVTVAFAGTEITKNLRMVGSETNAVLMVRALEQVSKRINAMTQIDQGVT